MSHPPESYDRTILDRQARDEWKALYEKNKEKWNQEYYDAKERIRKQSQNNHGVYREYPHPAAKEYYKQQEKSNILPSTNNIEIFLTPCIYLALGFALAMLAKK